SLTAQLSSRDRQSDNEPQKANVRPRSAAAPGYSSWPPLPAEAAFPFRLAMPKGSRRCSVGLQRWLRAPLHPSSTEATMRFYQQQHEFYCGVDLHARSMHVCIVDREGQTKVHKNIESTPDRFLPLIRPYRE